MPKSLRFSPNSASTETSDSLARIGAPAVPHVMALLGADDPTVRMQGANILAQIGPDAEAAVPALVARLRDPNPKVQKAAAHALGQIGPAAADAVPALLRDGLAIMTGVFWDLGEDRPTTPAAQ